MVALLFTGACEDDGDSVTGPVADTEWPSVTIISAPDASPADHEVALEFTVTDDVALDVVTVNWGAPGDPVETIPVEGRSFSGTCVHSFSATGQFTIVLEVRDESGRASTVTHEISITPPPPAAPIDVAVEVKGTRAIITWTPGAWATSQELTLTRLDQPEPLRTLSVSDGVLASFIFTDLSWDASYTVAVSAVNSLGRKESEPVPFLTPPPAPSTLTRFSATAADPTCLALEWTLGSPADETRVVITGDTEADSFEERYAWTVSEAELCAATHPILDGMTYTAQILSVLGGREYGSNTLEYTVDFNPPAHWATGSWTATWLSPEGEREILRMQLEDADGVITGSWESDFFMAEPAFVTGTRTWTAIDLTLHFMCDGVGYCPPNPLVGEFTDADTIEALLDLTWFDMPLIIRRD
jgi:hypothetical protein